MSFCLDTSLEESWSPDLTDALDSSWTEAGDMQVDEQDVTGISENPFVSGDAEMTMSEGSGLMLQGPSSGLSACRPERYEDPAISGSAVLSETPITCQPRAILLSTSEGSVGDRCASTSSTPRPGHPHDADTTPYQAVGSYSSSNPRSSFVKPLPIPRRAPVPPAQKTPWSSGPSSQRQGILAGPGPSRTDLLSSSEGPTWQYSRQVPEGSSGSSSKMPSTMAHSRLTPGGPAFTPAGPSSSTPVWTGPTSQPGPPRPAASGDPSPAAADSDVMAAGDVVIAQPRSVLFPDEGLQIFVSIVWQGGKLGTAQYDCDTAEIAMMPDTPETPDFTILRKLLMEVRPAKLILSAKQDDRLTRFLKPAGGEAADGLVRQGCLQMIPSIYFALDHCKRRLLTIALPSIPADMEDSARSLYLSSLIPMENINMVRALGGLLKYLDKHRIGVELEEESVKVPILALTVFSLKDMVSIDENTYGALQIFNREDHPAVYKTGRSHACKEGFSLFGILNCCRSQVGSRLLRLWFMRPTRHLGTLLERQRAIRFCLQPRNSEVVNTLHDCIKHIKNVSCILTRMTQSQASLGDWQALYKTAYNAIYIADICRAHQQALPIAARIVKTFTEDLHRIANLISRIVDFDESSVQNRFVVKLGVDAELDEKKRTYNGLPEFMTKVARQELSRLSDEISSCNVIYLPQLGYLLAIPHTDQLTEENNYHIPGLEFKFLSNNMVHYKSASTKELDMLLGDTQCDITDRETAIMHRLQNSILEHSQVLSSVMQLAAELDCLLSLACCAREGNYVCPELKTSSMLSIVGGRHPLQELCTSPFVPNDTRSGDGNSRIKVLTGPNASGKSVYLKQVGLIVFLAQIGSYVPVQSATIGLIDGIFTRIQTRESVSRGLSAFMIDLNQVSQAVHCATENSLVLLDEFGKGTQISDGIAILVACLKHWLAQREECPHIFTTTHFHSLVTKNLLPESPLISYQTMEVLHENEDLVFLYQLIDGSTDMSYACHIAALAGLPPEVVARGRQLTDLIRRHQPLTRADYAISTSDCTPSVDLETSS